MITGEAQRDTAPNSCSSRSLKHRHSLLPGAGNIWDHQGTDGYSRGLNYYQKRLGLLAITDEIKQAYKFLGLQIHQNTEFLVLLPSIGPRAMSENK